MPPAAAKSLSIKPPIGSMLAAHNKKPGARPGFSLVIEGQSVLRTRRGAEAVIQAHAKDMHVKLVGVRKGGATAARAEVKD